ncbi:Bud-site selection protein [Trametes punicea]|nr:Bud-site selection protein [Trametes punicea]
MVSPPGANGGHQRGTKRKRPAGRKTNGPVVKRETPAELIPKKLHHGLHEVRKAAKKAVAFELRKLVKRLKTARGEKPKKGNIKLDDPAELERQLEVLKHVDHEPFANTALKTKIMKDRLLSENEVVKAVVSEKLSENLVQPQPPGSSAAKVHGRILSSKTIADAVHAVVDSLKEILDPSLAKAKAKARSQESNSGDEEEELNDEDTDEEVDQRPTMGKKARLAASDEPKEGEDEEVELDDAGWESGTVDGDEGASGWESGIVNGGESRWSGSSDQSDEEERDDGDGDEDEDEERAAKKPKAKAPPSKESKGKSKAIGAESTFLPSLSVGFTRGDSDASDLSEADAEAAAADLPRKNRRGQRARRAIWEKKYGKNANHVKKQREAAATQAQVRGRGQWNGKGGERAARDGGKPGAHPRGKEGLHGQKEPSAAASLPAADKGWPQKQTGAAGKKRDDKPLHPSWEAKRKLKEKLNPSIIPAQGKKIKFS